MKLLPTQKKILYFTGGLILSCLNGPLLAGNFTTRSTSDAAPPQIVTAPTAKDISGSSAVIIWTTNELADSRVNYGPSTSLVTVAGDIDYRRQHQVTLTKLNQNTTYRYQVTTVDPKGNATTSSVFTFTTSGLTDQTLSFMGSTPAPTYASGGSFLISATATSGLPVSYSSQTPSVCAASGSTTPATVQILTAGTCRVQASQAGNGDYAAATPVTVDIAIAKANQATLVATATPVTIRVGETSQLSATGGSTSGVISYQLVSGVCDMEGAQVSGNAEGACLISATKPGDTNYNPTVSSVIAISVISSQALTPSPGGPVHASMTGGSVVSGSARFVPAPSTGSNVEFPYGVFTFSATSQPGGTVTVTLTFPEPLPVGTKIMKQIDGAWIDWTSRSTLVGRVLTFSITDGAYGDTNPAAGLISDPIGPALPATVGPGPGPAPNPIPTLTELAQIMMMLAMIATAGLYSWKTKRRKVRFDITTTQYIGN